MNALQQYIDLFSANRQLVDSGSAPAINSLRDIAAKKLSDTGLPKKGSENYEHTDLEAILAPDYGLNIARTPIPVNPAESFHCDVPNMSTALFFLINDAWAYTQNSYNKIPEGVLIKSLKRAAIENREIIERYYGSVANIDNPLVALNTMLVQDGLLLYVPKGVKVEKPIQLVNILQNNAPLMTCRRLLVIMEQDSEAQLLVCDHTQNDNCDFINLQTVEIIARQGAKFDLYDLEESSKRTNRLSTTYISQAENSNVLVDGITLQNGTTRNEYYSTFEGRYAELHLLGMAIEDEQRKIDTYSLINHNVPDCQTDELFKYVVDDEAVGAFSGRIYVAEHATKTVAYQANRNISGSEKARVFSKPQLEIYNDDVKCSHGTAIGQLDEQQIFYMRARGLSEETARTLLKQAFMADVIDGVRMPALKDRLQLLVEKRFSGEKTSCASCAKNDCMIDLNKQ